jgi:hypothetical protein
VNGIEFDAQVKGPPKGRGFHVHFSEIAEGGMAPLPVVKNFNVVKDIPSSFLTRVVVPAMNKLHLEGVEKALGHSVIPTIPLPAHTALNVGGFQ